MVATEVLKVRVPPETKQIVRTLAQQQQLTESALLMRLVQTLLQTSGAIRATTFDPLQPVARGTRLYVRLRPEDHALLRERPGAVAGLSIQARRQTASRKGSGCASALAPRQPDDRRRFAPRHAPRRQGVRRRLGEVRGRT